MNFRALIVDENIALARVTQHAFERAGFETQIARNGQIALKFAQERLFDVVITDQELPLLSGLEFCRALRRMPDYQECPILLLSAKGVELDQQVLQDELGIKGVFCKPFSPAAVVRQAKQQLVSYVPAGR